MTNDDTRVVNTADLQVLWRKAGPGKRPSKEWLDALDPDGIHTIYVLLPFMHDGAEHRCRGFAKTVGKEEGQAFEIDMTIEDYGRLHKASEFLGATAALKEEG